MDRFGLLSHHDHHHKSPVEDREKEESRVLVFDPSIAFLHCLFLLAIVFAAICSNLRHRSNSLRVDLRLVQVKFENGGMTNLLLYRSSWYILPPPT